MLGTAVGPLYIQMSRELQGSYNPVFYTLTLMPFLTGLLSLFLLVSTKDVAESRL